MKCYVMRAVVYLVEHSLRVRGRKAEAYARLDETGGWITCDNDADAEFEHLAREGTTQYS